MSVLEVGVGTGPNFAHYPPAVVSIDAIDTSPAMIAQAKAKFDQLKEATTTAASPHVSFHIMSTESMPLESGSFDTAVDTYGLCSYADPAAALAEMVRVTRADGRGRILLLERGRSNQYEWLNTYLDYKADKHARSNGCDRNRDIEGIVGTLDGRVKIVQKRVFHLGTSYLYVLAVPKKKDR
jgi:methyltransferase OMS1